MEGQDEVINTTATGGSSPKQQERSGQSMVKGKRTKRQRPQSPIPFRIISISTPDHKSDEGSDICSNNNNNNNNNNNDDRMIEVATIATLSDEDDYYYVGGITTTTTTTTTTEEEEDMANCLILLAQGQSRDPDLPQSQQLLAEIQNQEGGRKFTSRKFMEATTITGKSGYYVYECKTCSKTFPSFQALGGHRASHKKPKNKDDHKNIINNMRSNHLINNNRSMLASSDEEEQPPLLIKNSKHNNNNISSSSSLSLQLTNRALYSKQPISKPRVHECSICGAEFSSGQALGGHMRRHRAPVTPSAVGVVPPDASPMGAMENGLGLGPGPGPLEVIKRPINGMLSLDLDLNLPPAEDDHQRESSKFAFASKQQQTEEQTSPPQQNHQQTQLVFSSPALVDCHY